MLKSEGSKGGSLCCRSLNGLVEEVDLIVWLLFQAAGVAAYLQRRAAFRSVTMRLSTSRPELQISRVSWW